MIAVRVLVLNQSLVHIAPLTGPQHVPREPQGAVNRIKRPLGTKGMVRIHRLELVHIDEARRSIVKYFAKTNPLGVQIDLLNGDKANHTLIQLISIGEQLLDIAARRKIACYIQITKIALQWIPHSVEKIDQQVSIGDFRSD